MHQPYLESLSGYEPPLKSILSSKGETLEVGALVGNQRYKILKSLGEGLCSHVYLAEVLE